MPKCWGGVTLGEPGGLVGDSSAAAAFDGSSGAARAEVDLSSTHQSGWRATTTISRGGDARTPWGRRATARPEVPPVPHAILQPRGTGVAATPERLACWDEHAPIPH